MKPKQKKKTRNCNCWATCTCWYQNLYGNYTPLCMPQLCRSVGVLKYLKTFVWGVAFLRIETYCLHLQPRDFWGSNLQSQSRSEEIPLTEFYIVDSLWYLILCCLLKGALRGFIIGWAVGPKVLKFVISRPLTWIMKVCGSTMMRFWVGVGMLVREKGLLNFRVEYLDSQNI